MAKKYYVVWVGRETGIFTNWPYTKKQVEKYPQAKYKSFPTEAEAKAAFSAGHAKTFASAASGKVAGTKPATAKKAGFSSANPMIKSDVHIFCDGGCDPNPGKASSGVAVYRQNVLEELWYGLFNPHGTNNSAELNALHQSLLIAKTDLDAGKTVQVLCDSQYSINCVTVWAYSWKKKGWKRQTLGDIKNLEVIQQAHALYDSIKDKVTVSHVKAHIGIEGNELADRMSIYGIDQQAYEFCRYPDTSDITKLLALRAG
ncbi:viroplasmin family protein [Photobacterium swingsii]|uniref:ribonuclease H1 domain-containing protein n=1 Tax=Photobacterium swingsii TaxID=680026 RepID=UPI00354B01D1